jgi:hypothetical protein
VVASGALIEAGLVGLIPVGIAAWKADQMLEMLAQGEVIVQSMGTVISLFFSEVQQVNWRFGEISDFQLPDTPYKHPAMT